MNLNGTELMSYTPAGLTCGNQDYRISNICETYYHYWPQWYPTYHICEKSKIEQAFKIIGKLLENKIIEKDLTVKEFMKIVNDIAEII